MQFRSVALAASLAGLSIFGPSAANAVPVELQFSGTVAGSTTPGANSGNAITFDVFADNGGAGLASQNWSWTNIISATIQAGAYSATTVGPVSGGFGGFSTDASGLLASLVFATLQNGTDTNANTAFTYYMDGGNDIWFPSQSSFGAISPPNVGNTTISLVVGSTPLPAALPLFASGLGAMGFISWRRKRKAIAA